MISCSADGLRAAVGFSGQNLRTAPRTVGYPVGEAAHLGMPALLAGVASKGIRQGDYLPECFQNTTTRRVAAHRALNLIVAAGSQLTRFADRADEGMRSGS